MYTVIIFLVITFKHFANAQEIMEINGPIFDVQFSPSVIEELVEGDEAVVKMNITTVNETSAAYGVEVTSADTDLVFITGHANLTIPNSEVYDSFVTNFTIKGEWIGRTTLSFDFHNEDTNKADQVNKNTYNVAVVRPDRIEDDIFQYGLGLMIMVNNIGFGCKFDWKIAKLVFKKPLAVIIGVCGQYVLLPLVSIHYDFKSVVQIWIDVYIFKISKNV